MAEVPEICKPLTIIITIVKTVFSLHMSEQGVVRFHLDIQITHDDHNGVRLFFNSYHYTIVMLLNLQQKLAVKILSETDSQLKRALQPTRHIQDGNF